MLEFFINNNFLIELNDYNMNFQNYLVPKDENVKVKQM